MSSDNKFIDVIIPGPWWDAFVYKCEYIPEIGSRVLVPFGRGERIGFVLGSAKKIPDVEIKNVKKILDEKSFINYDLWDLALWIGHYYMCGPGIALKMILPNFFLKKEKIEINDFFKNKKTEKNFREINFFDNLNQDRFKNYISEIEKSEYSLVLFPEISKAENFYSKLPKNLKKESLLWPSLSGLKKIQMAWNEVYSGQFKIVIAPPSGVFAPLIPQKIIVDDEANQSYIFIRNPKASARSVAGRRALTLGADFIVGGNMPSSKTFFRQNPEESKNSKVDKKFFVTVDINYSLKEKEKGIDGDIFLTYSLIERTQKEIEKGNNVIWILDRLGESAEVFCSECGETIRCERCGGIMRSEFDGKKLCCVICGFKKDLPLKCENCGGEFFSGKRPGIDALFKISGKYFDNIFLYNSNVKSKIKNFKSSGLILGTKGILALLGKINPGLIAWLDVDNELRRPEYNTNFEVFKMLWDSYWNFREYNLERTVLVQARKNGMKFATSVFKGWSNFWKDELKSRNELLLPPYGYFLKIDCYSENERNSITEALENAGQFVMDPGEENSPLWLNVNSLEPIIKILSKYFSMTKSKFPIVTIFSE